MVSAAVRRARLISLPLASLLRSVTPPLDNRLPRSVALPEETEQRGTRHMPDEKSCKVLAKFLLLFLSFEPKQTSVRVRLTTVADAQPVLNFAACKRTYPPPLMCAMVRAHKQCRPCPAAATVNHASHAATLCRYRGCSASSRRLTAALAPVPRWSSKRWLTEEDDLSSIAKIIDQQIARGVSMAYALAGEKMKCKASSPDIVTSL